MDFTGRFISIAKDFLTSKWNVSVSVNEDVVRTFERLKDCDIDITIKKHRKKRSIDANRYYWSLLTEIAETLKISKPFAHNIMLRKYGQLYEFDGKIATVTIPDTDSATKEVDEATTYHLKPTSQVRRGIDGIMYRTYKMIRGSSDYDTKEMSELIDGVVCEAKELGIETLPIDEIEKMKREWGIEIEQKNKSMPV